MKLLVAKLKEEKGDVGAVPSKWLIPALIWQESEGYDNAIGDKHLANKAYGALQIRRDYMIDAVGSGLSMQCLNNRKLSLEVFHAYMKRYATSKRLGRPVTDKDIAKIHNSGPNGWRLPYADVYWYQVRAKVAKLEAGQVEATLLERITKTS